MLTALVLTAGLGTRLDPLTRLVAKAAVPLAGQTLIERSLMRLAHQGVTDAVLNLHHLPASITGVVGDGARFGMRVRYSWESPILGSAGGPRRALSLIDADRFLIVNGDTLCDIDLAAMIHDHEASGADVTMSVVPNPAPDHYNGIRIDDDRWVTSFAPRGQANGTWHFIGVQVVEARVFADLSDGVPEETVSGIYRHRIAAGDGRIRCHCLDLPFVDVGTPRDYLDAALSLAGAQGLGNAIEAGADVSPAARLSRCVVWSDAAVGARAILDDCVVAGVRIPDGFRTHGAVLVPAGTVRAGDSAPVAHGIAAFPLKR
ncbi:MAG TPA: sugar phosphate nucleotidyltransferase [Vicinamibacterales bacterium]|nr:sugar phosphate nucleotidyltransferase [Vicinamibacterales bacterium]